MKVRGVPDDPIFKVDEVNESFRGLSFTAHKVYCPHGQWPAYACRICNPPPPLMKRIWSRFAAFLGDRWAR